jgi:hypothetical protein
MSADITRWNTCARAAARQVMIFDVDGVLTDGSLTYGADGEAPRPSTCSTAWASSCCKRPAC